MEVLINHYAIEKQIGGKKFSSIINSNEYRREFFNFKLQEILSWSDKIFRNYKNVNVSIQLLVKEFSHFKIELKNNIKII